MLSKESLEALDLLDRKERVLAQLVVWLKAKGLWEEAKKDLNIGG